MLVSFAEFDVTPRFDGGNWGSAVIYETADPSDPFLWVPIDTIQLEFTDPRYPDPVDLTTENATLAVGVGYYKIRFVDAEDNAIFEETDPIFNAGPIEILATIDDVNSHLDGDAIKAHANNSSLIQISVARVIKGYLAKVVDSAVLASWVSPETTPDIIREIASMFIAAQVYFNASSRTSILIEDQNYAQRLYDEAMRMLNQILDGTIIVPGEAGGGSTGSTDVLSALDFFPADATDRAFTLSLRLD